jgi:hypothetical protein
MRWELTWHCRGCNGDPSSVVASDSSFVVAGDSSSVVAGDSSSVVAGESSSVVAGDATAILLSPSAARNQETEVFIRIQEPKNSKNPRTRRTRNDRARSFLCHVRTSIAREGDGVVEEIQVKRDGDAIIGCRRRRSAGNGSPSPVGHLASGRAPRARQGATRPTIERPYKKWARRGEELKSRAKQGKRRKEGRKTELGEGCGRGRYDYMLAIRLQRCNLRAASLLLGRSRDGGFCK